MTVFPEKSRSGSYTGRWIAEQRSEATGRKVRSRHNTMAEAEASLAGTEAPTSSFTLGNLLDQAEPILWKGTKDELQSCRRLRACLEILGRDIPIREVRKPQLEALARALGTSRGPKTVNRHLAALSRALRWAHECDLIPGVPSIPWQREPEGRIVYLPEDKEPAFLDALARDYGPEYAFAAEVLILTGLRIGELLQLQPEDVENDVVQLSHTKTGRPRNVPLPSGYGVRLRGWISNAHPNYRSLLDAISDASRATCGRCLTPHALRHTTATRLVQRGVNSLTVAQIMGHASLKTTRGYAHHETETLRAAMGFVK